MTRIPLRAALAVLALLALAACADPPADDDAGSPQPSSPAVALPPSGGLTLLVEYTGGFVSPDTTAARLPLVSLYADGRVYSEGPVALIYPGPALPNVLTTPVPEETVQQLVEQAMAAGVAETGDLGAPPVADAPSTRFTLVTAEGTYVREVYALAESVGVDDGLTAEQREGRAALQELLDALVATTDAAAEPYVPETLAVVTRPWTDGDVDPDLPQPDVTWPGPPLPGDPLEPALGLSCLTVAGGDVAPVLEAAAAANARTPWLAADGSRWALTFRPLLPHETGCADLGA
ncbi:hypothetical protein [Blastococcus sp. TF02A-26]|uniref:hypothetical protein n=1 Tax=Blastococcus sp. TF02A-26 TaxID=2250577 RepID=UPI000DEAC979|nr:hypothetical protein [Blastococcus sp. TF02A-26]RBY83956.1 hypothetical protein DQ240_15970 [Blastococcus sp. TF02A-26]